MNPRDALNQALMCSPGEGFVLIFETVEEAKRYLQSLSATTAHASRQTRRDLSPSDPAWGRNPWEGIQFFLTSIPPSLIRNGVCLMRPKGPIETAWVKEQEDGKLVPIPEPKWVEED